jgi:hypothetical protein
MRCRLRGLFRLSKQCFFVWPGAVSSSLPEVFHDVARGRGQGWPLGHRALARRAASLTAATRDITLEQAGLNQPCPSDHAARCPAISATGNPCSVALPSLAANRHRTHSSRHHPGRSLSAQARRPANSYPAEPKGSIPRCPMRGAVGDLGGGTNLDGGVSQPQPCSVNPPTQDGVRRPRVRCGRRSR